jgi:thymidine phosphorylase
MSTAAGNTLQARRLGIDRLDEAVAYVRADCPVCRSEGIGGHSRITLNAGGRAIIASLARVTEPWLRPDTIGLSEAAWTRLGLEVPCPVSISHVPPLASLGLVRQRIFDQSLDEADMRAIVSDISAGRYSDIQLTAFVAAVAARPFTIAETVAMTRAMIETGQRLSWDDEAIFDKHCVGGLPGNRTTPIIVAIVAAHGLKIPKTSSRAITSPAGTADTMEVLTDVSLDLAGMRQVVERQGGCLVWGNSVAFCPADHAIIRIERVLNFDSPSSMIASVLSKKVAAGATHIVIDIPVGPTAKVRTRTQAKALSDQLHAVAAAFELTIKVMMTDGRQPIGRGIGPALEARDVLAVLSRAPTAPPELARKACQLAGALLELAGKAVPGQGAALARRTLISGEALARFVAICRAQGGALRTVPQAPHQRPVLARTSGRVRSIDNRRLARAAKLAGAPDDKAAGLDLHVRLADTVRTGDTLYTLHTDSLRELAYVLDYLDANPDIVDVG